MSTPKPKPQSGSRRNNRPLLASRTSLERALRDVADPKRAASVTKFFKTGKGATLALVRSGDVAEAFRIAEKLLDDEHDLIHKPVGWALRESGKISPGQLVAFLQQHYERLPRTTLRYALERFPATQRKQFLAGEFQRP
jgi:3-methyladenine DNA glycosylase AlkD